MNTPGRFQRAEFSQLGQGTRFLIILMLVWTFLQPSIHFYLGEVDALSGKLGVSWAGLLDLVAFLMSFFLFIPCVLSRSAPRPFMLWPVLFYLLVSAYSVLLSPIADLAVRSTMVGIVPLLFFINITSLSKQVNLSDKIVRVVVLSSLFPMAIAVLQTLSGFVGIFRALASALPADPYSLEPYPGIGLPRASGTFFSYNPFAVFVSIVFMSVLVRYEHRLTRATRILILSISGGMIVAAFTRSVWYALLLAVGFAIFKMSIKARAALLVSIIAIGLVVLVTPLGAVIVDRFSESSSLEDRGMLSNYALNLFIERPWGYGAGMSRRLTHQLSFGKTFVLRGDYDAGIALHNDYLTSAIEGGGLLLGAYVLLIVGLVILAQRVVNLARNLRANPGPGIWLRSATIMLAIVAITDSGLIVYGSFAFWLLAAGVEMEYRHLKSITRQEQSASPIYD